MRNILVKFFHGVYIPVFQWYNPHELKNVNEKEAKDMDSCDSQSRSTYNGGTGFFAAAGVCICVFF